MTALMWRRRLSSPTQVLWKTKYPLILQQLPVAKNGSQLDLPNIQGASLCSKHFDKSVYSFQHGSKFMPAPHLSSPVPQCSPLTLVLQPPWLSSPLAHRAYPCSGPLHMPSLLPGECSQGLHICCPLLVLQLSTLRTSTPKSLLGFLSKPESLSYFWPITLYPVTLFYFSAAPCIKSIYSANFYWAPTMCLWLLGSWATLKYITMILAFTELTLSQERQKIHSKHGWSFHHFRDVIWARAVLVQEIMFFICLCIYCLSLLPRM